MKKLFSILLLTTIVIMCAVLLPTEAQAAAAINQGSCGINVASVFYPESGLLVISGTGEFFPDYAFDNSDIKNDIRLVYIDEGITYIPSKLLAGLDNLEEIYIPSTVTLIEYGAFFGCYELDVVVISDLKAWCNIKFSGHPFDRGYSPYGKEGRLFLGDDLVTSLVIPSGVTEIKYHAFQYCAYIESVVIPDSVETIGGGVFEGCSALETVVMSDRVTRIESSVFASCENLRDINLPSGLTYIGDVAFGQCYNLEILDIPDSVTYIGPGAFIASNCAQVSLPKSLSSLGDSAFEQSGITDVVIPEGVTIIEDRTFAQSSLRNITIPVTIVEIGENAFRYCDSLDNIYYQGSKKQWEALNPEVFLDNIWYSNPTIHFAINCNNGHTYDNDSDVECNICGEIREVHICSWNSGTVTKQPTCKEEGVKTYTCTACNATKTESIAKATTHTYGNWVKVNDSTHKHTCTVCSKEETANHSWNSGSVTKKATCKEEGVKTYTCTVCKETKTEAIAKLSTHSYDNGKVTKEATCKEAGVNTYTCTVCKETKTEAIAKLTTHTWDGGKVTKEATCKEEGVKTYTCTVCKETKTEAIAKLTTHTPGAEATATTPQICTVCGKELKPATGATEPPATEPPATEPPATEPPATEPPATEPTVTPTQPEGNKNLDDGEFPIMVVIAIVVLGGGGATAGVILWKKKH